MSLDADLLLHAYRSGIFPMAEHRDDPEIFWVDPRRRGVIPLDGFRISRSLARRLRRDDYDVTLDADFVGVIDACADRDETWINPAIRTLYEELHRRGCAHSLEVWMDGSLAGGSMAWRSGRHSAASRCFPGAGMARKLPWPGLGGPAAPRTLHAVRHAVSDPHLASLGGIEIPRSTYHARLAEALEAAPDIRSVPLAACGQNVVQRNTQTS